MSSLLEVLISQIGTFGKRNFIAGGIGWNLAVPHKDGKSSSILERSNSIGTWSSLVGLLIWVQEIAGSNPVVPFGMWVVFSYKHLYIFGGVMHSYTQ